MLNILGQMSAREKLVKYLASIFLHLFLGIVVKTL